MLSQLQSGQVADLNLQHISSQFFEELLTTSTPRTQKIGWRGIRLSDVWIDGPVDLSGATVTPSVQLTNCHFKDASLFETTRFSKDVAFEGCHFNQVSFFGMQVGGSANFRHAKFWKPLDFRQAQIAGNLDMSDAVFHDVTRSEDLEQISSQSADQQLHHIARFASINVKGNLTFKRVQFYSPLELVNANVGNSLDFSGAKFLAPQPTQDANRSVLLNSYTERMDGINVGADVWFDRATFDRALSCTGAKIGGALQFSYVLFNYTGLVTDFSGTKTGSYANFRKDTFVAPLLLLGSSFNHLDLSASIWKATDNNVVNGMTFQDVKFGSDLADPSDTAGNLLSFLNQADYDASSYLGAENFFRSRGDSASANQAFIDNKWRAMTENLPWYQVPGSFLMWLLTGYGRRPWLTLFYGAAFVAFGSYLYWNRKHMTTLEPEDEKRCFYNPVWYSLGLFLPIVDVGASTIWMPRHTPHEKDTKQRFRVRYMRVHILAGWILVPLWLASLLGLIR